MKAASFVKPRVLSVSILALLIASSVSVSSIFLVWASPDLGDEFTVSAEAGVTKRTLDVTWHAVTGQFLVVWGEYPDADVDGNPDAGVDGEIRGQLVNLDSSLAGGDFLISDAGSSAVKEFPQASHVANTNRAAQMVTLVVWMDDRDGEQDIWGQLVAQSGNTLQGTNFKVSGSDADLFPGLAYGAIDRTNGVFMAVWKRETAADESEVYGQIIRGATDTGNPGDLVGSNFQISETSGPAIPGDGVGSDAAAVAFDPVHDQFLVVWGDERGGDSEEDDVWGQFIDTAGNLVGANFQISSQPGEEYAPGVVYHQEAQEYLVVWNRKPVALGQSEVEAQRVSPAGALSGGVVSVAVTADQEEAGDFALDIDTGSYVVPLNAGPSPGDRVRVEMQKVNLAGSLVGTRDMVATDEVANKGPIAGAYGSTQVGPGFGVPALSEVLFVWRDLRSGTGYDVLGRMVEVSPDSDGDGLLDSWETNGYVDMNDNGVLDAGDFDFSALPAADQPDVNHKDLYVEVDWFAVDADGDGITNGDPNQPGDHDHAPSAVAGSLPTGTSLDTVISSFANLPPAAAVWNPDGTVGIRLHLDVGQMGGGNAITYIALEPSVDFFSGYETTKTANFASNRARVFRYALLQHENGSSATGRGEIWGNDFWVDGGAPPPVAQSVTFMHELGHTLGLRHGGADDTNCKPNYISIMNYVQSNTGILPTGRFDYSGILLPVLSEALLDETQTLGDGADQTSFSAGAATVTVAANVAVNWDNDGTPGETNDGVLPEPVSNTNVNNPAGFGCGSAVSNQVLNGFNDWSSIRYNWHSSPHVDDNIHFTHDEEDNTEAIKDAALAVFGSPSLTLDKAGTLAGLPGDPVSYTIEVENTGTGPARFIQIEDAWPAGLTFTGASVAPDSDLLNLDGSRTISWVFEDTLAASDSLTISLSGTIDFPPIGDFVTNMITVTAADVVGNALTKIEDSLVTDIQFPDIEFSKTATPTVNAGETITYTLIYENVGDADALGVVVTDTLPDDVYYSLALDLGAGPQPDSVMANVDGTTTITWSAGTLTVGSGQQTIEYTARPSLLFLAGDTVSNDASVDFTDANGNDYPAETGSATTGITAVSATGNPRTVGFWRNHQELWDSETLARIQATDQRYDGVDGSVPNGALSPGEVRAAFPPRANVPTTLKMQLLATYFNLATRRINSGTELTSSTAERLGLTNVREAVLFAVATLSLPFTPANSAQYGDAILILSGINANVL